MGLLSLLLGGVASGVGSQQPTNTNSNTTTAQSGSGTTSSSNAPTFSAGQTSLQSGLFPALNDAVSGGTAGATSGAVSDFSKALAGTKDALNPVLQGGIDTINKSADGSQARLNASEAGRGFGNSGEANNNTQALELGREGDIGSLTNNVDQQAEGLAGGLAAQGSKNYYNSLSDALNAGFADPGSSSTGSTAYNSAGGSVTKGSTAGTTLGGVLGGLGTFFTGASQAGAGLAGSLASGG